MLYCAMSAVSLLSVKSMEEMAMAELKYCWNTGGTGSTVPFLWGKEKSEWYEGGEGREMMVGR